jgi:hypothetical protein
MNRAGEKLVTETLNCLQSKSSVNDTNVCSAWETSGTMLLERFAYSLHQRLSGGTIMSVAVLTSVLLWAAIVGLALAL